MTGGRIEAAGGRVRLGSSRALARLRATRAMLIAIVLARAAIWALVAVLSFIALGTLGSRAGLLSESLLVVPRMLAALAGASVFGWLALRDRREMSAEHSALWIETRVPALQYALVTLTEPALVGDRREILERVVAGARWSDVLARAAARAIAMPLLLALALAVGMPHIGGATLADVVRGRGVPGASIASRTVAGSRLTPLRARVVPPAYSAIASRTIDEPSEIDALVGSAISLDGRGAVAGLHATIERASAGSPLSDTDGAAAADTAPRELSLVADGAAWRAGFSMPEAPSLVRLRDGTRERLIVLVPRRDSLPVVAMVAPARDSVLRVAAGRLTLRARATDDLGLADAWMEYIVSSGEGESFTFRSGVIGRARPDGGRGADLAGVLPIDSLKLAPGDIVHLRAVARDRRTGGDGRGVSETRTLRIARPDEYDSVAVEGAPPPEVDKSLMSQRMLIMMTEALQRRRPTIGRKVTVEESRRIGDDQARLRKVVGELVFSRLSGNADAGHSHDEDFAAAERSGKTTSAEALLKAASEATGNALDKVLDFDGDESPVVAVNRPLLEAYNAMWDAERELGQGEPARALPPMRIALAAIQKARAAERIYLRGRPPAVVVDLAKVRLSGKDKGGSSTRTPRADADAAVARRAVRLTRAIALLGDSAPARRAVALDSLLLLRLDAIGDAPTLAGALGAAVEALRSGRDASAALVRARRLSLGEPVARDSLARWSGAP